MSKRDDERSGEALGHMGAKLIQNAAKGEDLGKDAAVGAAIIGVPLAALAVVGGAGLLGALAVGGIFAAIGGAIGYGAGEQKRDSRLEAERRASEKK